MTEIYFDGKFIGTCKKPKQLVSVMIDKRRKGIIPDSVNITYHDDKDEVYINLESGRIRRPLIVVEKGKSRLTPELLKAVMNEEITWKQLTEQGVIEYLDAEEEENTYIAINEKDITEEHTHLELDPILILGVPSSLLVYQEKDGGARSNYGARTTTQAIGIYSQNYLIRADTTADVLNYPQTPIVESDSTKAIGVAEHPLGQNIVVAIMPFYGYNMEDAYIINKGSIERCLGRSTFLRTYTTEARRYWGGQEDELAIPDETIKGYRSEDEYKKLDKDGLINPETEVGPDDVLVGKTSPLRFLGVVKEIRMGVKNRRETSLTVKKGEGGIVEKVMLTEDENGNKLVKVVVREPKLPEIGDKFTTRHGQKGVIGLIVPEEDMPFTKDGITPDIIINPHAIPSRMTIGQILELIAGKTGALAGEKMNGTVFKGDEKSIRATLEKMGFADDGKEIMYNGITGEQIESSILIGIGYFQRLYHMVSHKIHARSKGPVALLTKQPTEGRSKEGGLRFGEMEKDCLVGHGAAITLKERFSSDMTKIQVCRKCGITAINDKIKGKTKCPVCKGDDTVEIEISYAFKLLLDEMRSMMIHPHMVIGEEE